MLIRRRVALAVAIAIALTLALGRSHSLAQTPAAARPAIVFSEFIFTSAPFRHCHASTLVELPGGTILAAWFAGEREGDPGVAIWGARRTAIGWTAPFQLAREPGLPSWNPVLFADGGGTIWLFYKYGSSQHSWVGAYRTSRDGVKWSTAKRLPDGILGPAKNKPITLANGDILAGSSVESILGWTSWVDLSSDHGRTWHKYGPISAGFFHYGVIQPALWEAAPGHVKMLMRSFHDLRRICAASSDDGGRTWSAAKPTTLPNPDSGIDAVKMSDGTVALAYNNSATARTPLSVAFSRDDGNSWSAPLVLEDQPGEYSYPAIIQTRDGLLHVTYSWKRQRIKHVIVDPRVLGY